jgi:hypothetical protein
MCLSNWKQYSVDVESIRDRMRSPCKTPLHAFTFPVDRFQACRGGMWIYEDVILAETALVRHFIGGTLAW